MKNLIVSIVLLFHCFLSTSGFSQVSDEKFREAARLHINHIEEFIERFNFQENSAFYEYIHFAYPRRDIDRADVLRALFNRRVESIPNTDIKEFIANVTNTEQSVLIDIYDALWYAVVPVEVTVDTLKMDMTVTLEIQMNYDFSIQWAIVAVNSKLLDNIKANNDFFISASSHATFFPELYSALSSAKHFQSAVSQSQKNSNTEKYYNLIAEKRVQNVAIKKGITYHFLQIGGWIMVVDYTPQDYSLNSGWLISKLIRSANFRDKRLYQKKVLGINNTH